MPKISNIHAPNQIIFQFNLVKTESFIYNKENDNFSNWFPCDIGVFVEERKYEFEYIPTLNLEGLKNFINNFDLLVEEKTSRRDNLYQYRKFEYFATEGEFIINFRNIDEEESMVETEVWINMAACEGCSDGYFTGFRFYVSLYHLKKFFKKIKKQLFDLTNGNEGEKNYNINP